MPAPKPTPAEGQQATADTHQSPSNESQAMPAYGPSDFLVQNLPPGMSDDSQNNPKIRETEQVLQLAYAWSQMEVAASALSSAYAALKEFDKDKLQVRTLKQRMRKVREATKEMVEMVNAGESGKQEREDAG